MAETKDLKQRLTRQLAAKGVHNAKGVALGMLVKRGQMSSDGTLTKLGMHRQKMGAAGRAKDRAAKASGHDASAYTYDAKTNKATLK